MMPGNEDTTVQAVKTTFRASQITAQLLLSVLKASEHAVAKKIDHQRSTGEQSIKRLARPGLKLEKLDFNQQSMDVKALKTAVKKYSLDFHLYKDQTGNYQLWYRMRDAPLLQAAMEQVVKDKLQSGPNVKEQLKNIKNSQKQAAQQPKLDLEKGGRLKDRGLER